MEEASNTCRWKALGVGENADVDADAVEATLAFGKLGATREARMRQRASEIGEWVMAWAKNPRHGSVQWHTSGLSGAPQRSPIEAARCAVKRVGT